MSTPPEEPPRTETYGYQPGTTLDIARLPIPGNAELFVYVVVLLIFGGTFASRLPKLARSIGQSSNEFKKGLKEGQEEGVDKDEAEKLKSDIEEAGGSVEIK